MDFEQKISTLGDIPGGSLYEIDEDNTFSSPTLEELNYEPTQVILFKKVPYEAAELDVINLCRRFGVVTDIYLIKAKGYAFVQFQLAKSAVLCYEVLKRENPQIKSENVFAFYTGKKEIYKQETGAKLPTRSLILMFSTNSEIITNHFVNKLLSPFGWVIQIKLLQSHPPSVYAEMEDIGSAIMAKENLNNSVYGNSFKISVGYVNNTQATLQPDQSQFHFASLQNVSAKVSIPSIGELYPPGMNVGFPRSEGYLDFKESEKPKSLHNDLTRHSKVPKSPGVLEDNTQNTVLLKNLPRGMTCSELFKLFGTCGNVMKIKIFYSNPENALIEMQDNNQAVIAKSNLNNCPLRGHNIFVTISKNPIIFNVPFIPENNKFLGDYTDSKEHRYKIVGSKNFRNIAPPSPVLHLSNLCDDKEEDFYVNLFRNCGRIRKFLNLKGDSKNMLMEMENVQQAVEILISFHNFNIEGKFLKVSFSKYQTIKD